MGRYGDVSVGIPRTLCRVVGVRAGADIWTKSDSLACAAQDWRHSRIWQ